MRSLRENFGNHCVKDLELREKCRQLTIPKLTEKRKDSIKCWEGIFEYLSTMIEDDSYHLLPLAEYAYNNSVTTAHDMTSFFANYRYHPQTEWLKEREAQNPGANLYAHWMQTIHQQARQSRKRTWKAMGQYYSRKAKQQPDFKVGDLVRLNAKNI